MHVRCGLFVVISLLLFNENYNKEFTLQATQPYPKLFWSSRQSLSWLWKVRWKKIVGGKSGGRRQLVEDKMEEDSWWKVRWKKIVGGRSGGRRSVVEWKWRRSVVESPIAVLKKFIFEAKIQFKRSINYMLQLSFDWLTTRLFDFGVHFFFSYWRF